MAQSRAAGSLDQPAELLSDFLPQSPEGSIPITSRTSQLRKKLGSITNEDEAVEPIQGLDFTPVAITQAAAFIKQRAPRIRVSRYVKELYRNSHDRARLLKKAVADSRRDGQASACLATICSLR